MSRVTWIERTWVPPGRFENKEMGEAEFMAFGVDCEQFDNGVGSWSTAIIKLPNGKIRIIPVEHITFIEE